MTGAPDVTDHPALRIARSLLDSEGCDPEALSVREMVGDYAAESGLSAEESDKLSEQVGLLIKSAVTVYEFDLRILT